MLFHNTITDEYAILFSEEAFDRWRNETSTEFIKVRDNANKFWWEYSDLTIVLPWEEDN